MASLPEKSGTWRDIRLWLWQGDHPLQPDEKTLCVCFERRGESGYVYTVVTPDGVRTMSLNAFYARVKGHRTKVDISDALRKGLFEAWQEGYDSLVTSLQHLDQRTAVVEGVQA